MPIPSDNSLVEFVIADLTYCRGDCSLAAISRKQNKYDGIADRLRARGFRVRGFTEHSLLPKEGREVYATHIAVLALGISGEVYKATHHVMSALGLDAQAISKLTKALHVHGLTQTDSILSTRKFLDNTIQSGDSGPTIINTSATPHQPTGPQPAVIIATAPHPPAGEG